MVGCSNAAVPVPLTVYPLPSAPLITQVNDTLYATGTGNFQWYLDGSMIPGATGSFYIPLVNGNYSVTLTDSNGCAAMSVVLPVTNVGINEPGNLSFAIFPNPSSGLFEVMLENPMRAIHFIRVFDPSGKMVLEATQDETQFLLNLSGFDSGIYFMEIRNAIGSLAVEKLIKQ